ncbi:MAG: hypothetical protein HYU39_09645 [Thaumarchaeota archaeon]|nr:hypothetical protein [Nitrososphaerota archaeon]
MSTVQTEPQREEVFLKDFAALADYFSRSITSVQKLLGMEAKDALYRMGQVLGEETAKKFAASDLRELILKLSRHWEASEIGRLDTEKWDPLTLIISDCAVCGQLPGTGGMFNCAFHEGFFEGLLSTRMGRKVKLEQITNFEGSAGTWCRRYVTDVKL